MTTALVVGGADTLYADLAAWGGEPDIVVGVNEAMPDTADARLAPWRPWFDRMDAIATLHGEKALVWRKQRAEAGYPPAPYYSQDRQWTEVLEVWRPPQDIGYWTAGSSGLFAVGVALHVLGAERVVLAGVPLTPDANIYRGTPWRRRGSGKSVADRYRPGWKRLEAELRGRVVSMSGWTRALLGGPDQWEVHGVGAPDR